MTFLSSHLPHCLAVLAALTYTFKASPIVNVAPAITRLPAPLNATFSVGTQVFNLVDDNRLDPWNTTEKRAVEITVYYPSTAQNNGTCPGGTDFAPYMPAVMAGLIDQRLGILNGTLESVRTDACLGAPAVSSDQRKLIVMSPGLGSYLEISLVYLFISTYLLPLYYLGSTRLIYQTSVIPLAAHGYVVVSIDHPSDAAIVEYPDGQLIPAAPLNTTDPTFILALIEVRIKDVQFVLDQVCSNKNLTQGIPVDCGVRKVGMFGEFLGGSTTAAMTIVEQRIAGGINFDGTFSPIQSGPYVAPETPFLVVAAEGHDMTTDPTYGDWFKTPKAKPADRIIVTVRGAGHVSFTDFPILFEVLGLNTSDIAAPDVVNGLGTIEGHRISEIGQVANNAWFDLILKGNRTGTQDLLTHAKEDFPELEIVLLD
ncbi:hypothetical protein FRB95_006578 [Tulasnella sp. JGI-2019a]|nr:hypothetical protein FRB95_006578 [Tulasnella sp. JGI-2019a]